MGKTSPLDQHFQTLLGWNEKGVLRKEMARRLGVTKACVQAYLQRRNIQPAQIGRGKTLDRELLLDLIQNQKMTQHDAAKVLQCHVTTVERAVANLGLKTQRTGPRSAQGHKQKWSGGRCLDKHGYVLVFAPMHPHCSNTGYVREHRAVLETLLRRYLLPTEVVDHIDNHPQHNWPDNLRIYSSNADHLRSTLSGREKATPRSSIPGAYGNNQKILDCPALSDTLAQCSAETIANYERFLSAHRPTLEHAALSRKEYFRQGPHTDPWTHTSKG